VVFVEAVRARGVELEGTSTAPASLVTLRITENEGAFDGEIQISAAAGTSEPRTARGSTCEEVIQAMAVIAALTLEQRSALASTESPAAAAPKAEALGDKPAFYLKPRAALDPVPQKFEGYTKRNHGFRDETAHEAWVTGPGTVHLDRLSAITVAVGASFGLLPGIFIPELELNMVSAQFLTLPGGGQTLVGVIPIVRYKLLGPGIWKERETEVNLWGFSFGIGLCATPHFDSDGWVLLGCAVFGGGMNYVDAWASTPADESNETYLGFGELSLTGQIGYNFASHFHVTLLVGGSEFTGPRNVKLARDDELLTLGFFTAFATLGVGVHY
jgi:hypothetical protein